MALFAMALGTEHVSHKRNLRKRLQVQGASLLEKCQMAPLSLSIMFDILVASRSGRRLQIYLLGCPGDGVHSACLVQCHKNGAPRKDVCLLGAPAVVHVPVDAELLAMRSFDHSGHVREQRVSILSCTSSCVPARTYFDHSVSRDALHCYMSNCKLTRPL